MNTRTRALAYLVTSLYFGACLLLAGSRGEPSLAGAAAFGMGASLTLSVVWWERAK